jgi:hypothetical protein
MRVCNIILTTVRDEGCGVTTITTYVTKEVIVTTSVTSFFGARYDDKVGGDLDDYKEGVMICVPLRHISDITIEPSHPSDKIRTMLEHGTIIYRDPVI